MPASDTQHVIVGLGVIIERDGKILIGQRLGVHAPYYSIPGGHLDPGETFEQGCIREIREETGMKIDNLSLVAITNNVETYQAEGKHTISVVMKAGTVSGEPEITEPHKCGKWLWADPHELPQPHFEASEKAVTLYMRGEIYSSVS